jgi:16S rRNA (cytosine967-C5)-methyltransferase
VRLETRINAFSLEAFREGLFEIQDEGSQVLGMLVDAPPTQVLDACAGAGGKTLQLAAQMKNRGELHALDIDARRLEELKRRARRAGVHNVRIHALEKQGETEATLEPFQKRMDRVLIDAPCSGTGTLRRKPDARYRLTEAELKVNVERQKRLLGRFAPLLKVKGRLIYGTCSVLREENEAVVEDFLSRHSDFERRPVSEKLPAALTEQVSQGGYLRLYTHRHGTDGFFGALIERVR